MASTSQEVREAIKQYFVEHNFRVKDEVFSKHFKQSIREHRDDFRHGLNALTTIEKIDQINYFVLKPEFRNKEYEGTTTAAPATVYNDDESDDNHSLTSNSTRNDDSSSDQRVSMAGSASIDEDDDIPIKKIYDKSHSVPVGRDESLTTISEDAIADGSMSKYDSLDRTPKVSTIGGYSTTSKRRASKGSEYVRTPNRKKSSITTAGPIGRSTTDDTKGRMSLRRKPSGNGMTNSPSILRSTKMSTIADLTAISEEQPTSELVEEKVDFKILTHKIAAFYFIIACAISCTCSPFFALFSPKLDDNNLTYCNESRLFQGDADSVEDDYYYGLDAEEHDWMRWSSMCNIHLLKTLLEKDESLLDRRDFVSTALHWAAKQGNADVVGFLCGHGADANIRSGYTPLHLALMHDHEDIAKLLIIKYKADPSIRDYSGKRPGSFMNLHSANANRKKDSSSAAPSFASTAIALVAAAALPASPVTPKKSMSTV
ncbi:Ankyrin repeat domain-containing protein SOWAHA [Trichoplax sp. H2]|nr:Ankyrin repeat domain-containing protein SOWAHA [Trichoplax sp. H2]|eukprot:RDD47693.1 Ankyrin repeat domain-containing protein SOWAHA [Trichoplax sp. H2]